MNYQRNILNFRKKKKHKIGKTLPNTNTKKYVYIIYYNMVYIHTYFDVEFIDFLLPYVIVYNITKYKTVLRV